MCNVWKKSNHNIMSRADKLYQECLLQIINNSASRASYFRASYFHYFRCRLFSNIKRHIKMIGGRGLEKYFFHSTREVNSAVHTP